MRCILIDAARRKLALRHGGGQRLENLDGIEIAAPDTDERVLAVHEALERLAAVDAEKAGVVKLRYFVGMSVEEHGAGQTGLDRPLSKSPRNFSVP